MGPWVPMFPLFGHIVNLQLVGFESSIEKCFPFALLHPWEAKKAVAEDLKRMRTMQGGSRVSLRSFGKSIRGNMG